MFFIAHSVHLHVLRDLFPPLHLFCVLEPFNWIRIVLVSANIAEGRSSKEQNGGERATTAAKVKLQDIDRHSPTLTHLNPKAHHLISLFTLILLF